jgi:hypothetical protein
MNSSPKKKRQAAQRLVVPSLEGDVVDLIDRHAEQVERRQHDHRRQDRIDPQHGDGDIGDVGAQQDESGMGDIDDIQHAEGNRHTDDTAA